MSVERIGKYRVIAKLGQGGMARVLLTVAEGPHAFHKLLVVKELKDDLAHDPEFLTMFLDEARIAARLNHPNIVQTYEVGNEGARYFLAMEYLEGQPLNAIFRRIGRKNVPLEIHLRIVADVLAGLEHAHDLTDFDGSPLHIVHRDISPQNILVTYAGQVKIVDFGIAKAAGASSTTKEGILKGKISYIAPEQARCEPVDARADLYAVGVILWEAVAGRRLVQKEDEMSILSRRMSGRDPSIREVLPSVPAELAAICDRAMASDVADRFPSAREFREVIERYLGQSDFRVGPKEIGQLVSDAFDDERVRIRSILEEQMKNLDRNVEPVSIELVPRNLQATSDSLPRVHPGTSGAYTSTPPSYQPSAIAPSEPPAGANLTALTQALPTQAKPKSMLPAALVGVGAVALVAAGATLLMKGKPTDGAPTSQVASPQAAAKEDKLTLTVKYPAGATLKLDGGSVEGNPFTRTLARDGTMHSLEVTQPGFSPEKRTVTFDRDVDMTFELTATGAATAEPEPTAAPVAGHPWRPGPRPAATEKPSAQPTSEPTGKTPAPSVTIDEDNPYKKKAP
jgi:serine/threonine-protein kinase